MVLRLINKPPVFTNLPPFLLKRFAKNFVERLIAWSQKEYYDSINDMYATNNSTLAKYLEKNCTPVDFLAHSTAFRKLHNSMNGDIWATLDRKTQDILIDAKNRLGE